MKFPWVSRETHEALLAEKDARITQLTEQVERHYAEARSWRSEARDSRAQLAELAKPKEPATPAPLVPAPREVSPVSEAIREMAQGDMRLAAMLHTQKRELKALHPHMSDDGIIAMLCTWETTEALLDAEVAS